MRKVIRRIIRALARRVLFGRKKGRKARQARFFFFFGRDLYRGPKAWHLLLILFPDWARAVEGREIPALMRLETGFYWCLQLFRSGIDSTAWTGRDPDWEFGRFHWRLRFMDAQEA